MQVALIDLIGQWLIINDLGGFQQAGLNLLQIDIGDGSNQQPPQPPPQAQALNLLRRKEAGRFPDQKIQRPKAPGAPLRLPLAQKPGQPFLDPEEGEHA